MADGTTKKIKDIDVGDVVEATDPETGVTKPEPVTVITAVRNWTGLHDMRNLTIQDLHTYYVLAGNTPVLVHNCPRATGKGRASDTPSWFSNGQRPCRMKHRCKRPRA